MTNTTTSKPGRSLVKRARIARGLVEGALTEINRACKADEIVNHSEPVGFAVAKLQAVLSLLRAA